MPTGSTVSEHDPVDHSGKTGAEYEEGIYIEIVFDRVVEKNVQLRWVILFRGSITDKNRNSGHGMEKKRVKSGIGVQVLFLAEQGEYIHEKSSIGISQFLQGILTLLVIEGI